MSKLITKRFRTATVRETLAVSGHRLPRIAGAAGPAIDASTPPYVFSRSNVSTQTTASFTPPVNSELVVMYSNANFTTVMNSPTNTGGVVSWDATIAASEASNSCAACVWLGTVTTSAAMTVTVTIASAQNDWGFGVAVITGQAGPAKGATAINTSASGTPTVAISSLQGTNSLVLASFVNFSDSTIGTPDVGQSVTFGSRTFSASDATLGSATWAQYLTGENLSAGVSATVDDTAPTAIAYSAAAVEILASGVAVPFPQASVTHKAAMRAKAQ